MTQGRIGRLESQEIFWTAGQSNGRSTMLKKKKGYIYNLLYKNLYNSLIGRVNFEFYWSEFGKN